jgi:hypothetical protein
MEVNKNNRGVFSLVIKCFGLLSLIILLMSPSTYEVSFPYFGEQHRDLLISAVILIYSGLAYLEWRRQPSKFFKLLFTFGYSGISTLGVHMVAAGWFKWDIVVDKFWFKIIRKYSIDEKLLVGERWCREFSEELTGGECRVSQDMLKEIVASCETMGELRRVVQQCTVDLYLYCKLEEFMELSTIWVVVTNVTMVLCFIYFWRF